MSSWNNWRVSGKGTLFLRDWDGEYAVYNPLSGSTHILDVVSGRILRSIIEGDTTLDALRERIAGFLEVPNDQHMAEHIDHSLTALDELGLIEPNAGC